MPRPSFDALLLVSFGGPERREDVLPFLENVLRGRNVPEQRKLAAAEHYDSFGGVSPINAQNRELIAAIRDSFRANQLNMPVFWGNLHWNPMLTDAVRQMAAAGVTNSLALITSAYSSEASCRRYLQCIEAACREIGPAAPRVAKLRAFFNHPRFIEAWVDRARQAINSITTRKYAGLRVLFTAHSIPLAMAAHCDYERQLREVAQLIAGRLGLVQENWQLVYQSRSGSPRQPWLEPDVCDAIGQLGREATISDVLLIPVGFLSDHVEILYDLDIEAYQAAEAQGLRLTRAGTVGTHPHLVTMVHELVQERLHGNGQRAVIGKLGPAPDHCPDGCCVGKPLL